MFPRELYTYSWILGTELFINNSGILETMSHLYSNHYGVWSQESVSPGRQIRLSAEKIREWLKSPDSKIALAYLETELIGYAIAVQSRVPKYGVVSWVTQFVIHEKHRNKGVGKALLFSIWGFTDHFAWGIVTANPYAVRALEKATRRRCDAGRITRNHKKLLAVGTDHVPYIKGEMKYSINARESQVDTRFLVDHSELKSMLANVVTKEKPWRLGDLPSGREWFAFTFNDQEQLSLTADEIDAMLEASDEVVKQAYSKMRLDSKKQKWALHSDTETDFIINYCRLKPGSCVLDCGCGLGRHTINLAQKGMLATGLDYIEAFIERAKSEALKATVTAEFVVGDCRSATFDAAFDLVLCLYDVIGTYSDNLQNKAIVQNISGLLRPGGKAVISVMNYALTEQLATNKFIFKMNPTKLLELPPSSTMEKTGNVFDPAYLMLDTETQVVYRREQFASVNSLPVEMIVRDKRFRKEEIEQICEEAGMTVLLSRFVHAGDWNTSLGETDSNAKEILLICEKPTLV